MKVTIVVEVVADVKNDIDSNEITLELDLARTFPIADGETCGRIVSYATTESFINE